MSDFGRSSSRGIPDEAWTEADQRKAFTQGWWLSWSRARIEPADGNICDDSEQEMMEARNKVARLAEEGDPTALKALRVLMAHAGR